MEKIENIIGFHGTKKKFANNIFNSQKFIINKDEKNELFLGNGIYFYYNKEDAIFWNIRTMQKSREKISFIIYKENYDILEVSIEYNTENFMDLDDIRIYSKFQMYCKSIEKVLKNTDFNKNNENRFIGPIINLMQKRRRTW